MVSGMCGLGAPERTLAFAQPHDNHDTPVTLRNLREDLSCEKVTHRMSGTSVASRSAVAQPNMISLTSTSPVNPAIHQAFVLDEQARIRGTLARVAIFRDLAPSVLEDLGRRVSVRRVQGGDPILTQEQVGDALYIVMAGRVKVVMAGETGREVTLAVLRPADIFGEMALFDGRARSANVVAIDPVTVLALDREEVLRHLADHPQTALNLLGEMSRRLRKADETIAELALCDVQDRLIRRLVALAQEDGTELPEGALIRRRPTQQDLANMVGACRETISRTFNTLARRGLIVPRGRSLLVTRRLVSMSAAPAKAA
jgi:CRP-like cAMP-binding protein